MSRAWDEWVAGLFDVVSPQLVLFLLLAGSALTAVLWYFHPAWVPRGLPRLPRWRVRLPGWRRRRAPRAARAPKPARAGGAAAAAGSAPDRSIADRLAAEGRYAEAIRERLRDTVRALSAAGVVRPEPGQTAVEVAAAAAVQRPAVARPLDDATELFSEVWYGYRPAGHDQDEHMRALSGEVRARLWDGGAR